MEPLSSEIVRAFALLGTDGPSLLRAFARLLPTVILVPAFGLRGLAPALRLSVALVLSSAIAPAFAAALPPDRGLALPLALALEALRGLPVALASALPLWAGTMGGGLFDELRSFPVDVRIPAMAGARSPSAVLLSLLGGSLFFAAGGPSNIAMALARPELDPSLLERTARTLASGATLAVIVAGPLVASSILLSALEVVISRGAPSSVRAALQPLRGLALLALLALALDRIALVLASLVADGAR